MADESNMLPAGMQAGPAPLPTPMEPLHDEMGVANPTLDISEFIKYRFYKCQKCGRKEFAGAMDMEPFADCICPDGPEDPKTKKRPHGKMKLLTYVSRRDKEPMTPADYARAELQK